jgi:uncharacterized protein YndB with AHSA1/START domain
MTQPSSTGRSTEVPQMIHAPREAVYWAFMDAKAVETWLAPDTMRGKVEIFEPREGGKFRMSLTYTDPQDAKLGKTSDDTDTSEGTFVELIPNQKMVWAVEFDSDQPEFAGEMRMTWTLADSNGGTEVTLLCEDIPAGIRLEDNELGSKQSLQKLAKFVEAAASKKSS